MTANGPIAYEFKTSAYNANSFASFLQLLIEKVDAMQIGKCIFIMDNATIHRHAGVRDVVEPTRHEIKYLPPYSPFLNPIEECFSKWKGFVKALNVWNEEELLEAISHGFESVAQENCEGWFRNMISYLNRSRSRSREEI